jgi:hypothetical protein
MSKASRKLASSSMPSNVVLLSIDPVLAAIADHKIAFEVYNAAITHRAVLEDILPDSVRRSSITAYSREIVKTDDPRWIASERAVMRTGGAADAAAMQILSSKPTTLDGAVSLLCYAYHFVHEGNLWPEGKYHQKGRALSWETRLHKVVADALVDMAAAKS